MKKIICIVTSFLMLLSNVLFCMAQHNDCNSERIVYATDFANKTVSSEKASSADAIVLDEDNYDYQSIEEIQELVDNGTKLVVKTSSQEALCDDFQIEKDDSLESPVGYILENDGLDYVLSTIDYEFMCDERNQKQFTKKDYNKLIENEPLDVAQIIQDSEILKNENHIKNVAEQEKDNLQASTALGHADRKSVV